MPLAIAIASSAALPALAAAEGERDERAGSIRFLHGAVSYRAAAVDTDGRAGGPVRAGVFALPGLHDLVQGRAQDGVDDPSQAPARADARSDAPASTTDLAKQLQNPVANLISVPLQLNYDNGYGDNDAERWTLNVQPVIPFELGEDWNLISRTIVPILYQERLTPGDESDLAIGDVVQSVFFSPKEPIGGWIVGVGPAALLPTGTDPDLRAEQLALGPTAVALRQRGGWTYGMLMNHLWHVAGTDDVPDITATFLQPFASYTFPTATSITLNSESTYDWRTEQWTVPLNLVLGQVSTIGSQPVSYQFGVRYYAQGPGGGPEFGLRFGLPFLFPK
jgi:hypothetical protein